MKKHGIFMRTIAMVLLAHSMSAVAHEAVELRRTAYGIVHVKAASEHGIGYGIGYAYAEDNVCLLANEVVTVNGERSKFFGEAETAAPNVNNLQSDFFFRWLNSDEAVGKFLSAQPPEIRALLSGYVAGYNQYLHDVNAAAINPVCGGKPWLRTISENDLVKIMRSLLVHGGAWQFSRALLNAVPPAGKTPDVHTQAAASLSDAGAGVDWELHTSSNGSNAIAIGRDLSANGSGILLGNPHFPWEGGLRFYQMHLTIPGKLDVMGAALPGLPLINIGFNRKIAWTHTLDASSHFSVYRLQLDPHDPTHYLVDGESQAMKRIPVTVEVRDKDGKLSTKTHDFYETRYGLLMSLPGPFAWSEHRAYALRDSNLDNDRPLRQWYAMDKAESLDALQKTVTGMVGIPWATTLAVDPQGNTLFMNVSAIPGMDQKQIDSCAITYNGKPVSIYNGVPVLDGARRQCAWKNDLQAPQNGILAGSQLPVLRRSDYVQNSNDSAWLAQPAAPLTGFPLTVSRENVELSPRSRFAIDWLQHGDAGSAVHALTPERLQAMLMSNQVYMAARVLDDVLRVCQSASVGADGNDAVPQMCTALQSWDRTANLDAGAGYLYFAKIVERLRKLPQVWRYPFDPKQPLDTPRQLAIEQPEVAKQVLQLMAEVARESRNEGILPTMKWGEIQIAGQAAGSAANTVPIHGGSGNAGVYNVIESVPAPNGKRTVISGSSYIQVVWFEHGKPRAHTLLTYSESSDPGSPHNLDQTRLFSEKRWVDLPFTEAEIKSDPAYSLKMLHP